IPLDLSRNIREINSKLLDDDSLASILEAEVMIRQLCGPADLDEMAEEWKENLRINGSVPWNAQSSCDEHSGLTSTTTIENGEAWKTNIKIVWRTELNVPADRLVRPFDLSLVDSPDMRIGSIMESVEHSPAIVKVHFNEIYVNSSDIWNLQEPLSVGLPAPLVADPTVSDQAVAAFTNPVIVIPVIIVIGSVVVLVVRRRMRFEYELDEECHACGKFNSPGSINCNECGALFVYDNVMEKLHGWMIENGLTVVELFEKFDEDGNGTLEEDELLRGLRSLRIADLPMMQLQALVESLDEDGNGVIDLEEFEIALGSVDTMHFDDDDYMDELEERWEQEIPDEPAQKMAPRPPPDRRKTVSEPEEIEEEKPRRIIRRKSKASKSGERKRVKRSSKKTSVQEKSDATESATEDDYDEALRRLTGSGFEDED
ncbi:MAG: EF-hand domain-containing protein, partial [Candidatus Thalassarchaeaceae archaeon]|nr:EF-hand domain-containing protein [Candidatus Thalassarchaeaceae archaeon]